LELFFSFFGLFLLLALPIFDWIALISISRAQESAADENDNGDYGRTSFNYIERAEEKSFLFFLFFPFFFFIFFLFPFLFISQMA